MKKVMKNRIKALREAQGLSQAALAERMGTSAAQVNRLEKGQRKLTVPWLLRLGAALDASADEITDLPLKKKAIGGAKCDQALLGSVLGFLLEAGDKLKIKPTHRELAGWAAYVYNEAVERPLSFHQSRDLATQVVKISRKFGKKQATRRGG